MKTYVSNIIPKLKKYSQKLDNLTLLTNQHWTVIDELYSSKNVYIFRTNNELLISKNGIVEKAKWEYLDGSTLLIDLKSESYLFRHGFFDENVLALKLDGKNEYAFLVNETKYEKELNSIESVIEFLKDKYLSQKKPEEVINTTGKIITKPKEELLDYKAPKYKISQFPKSTSNQKNKIIVYEISFVDGKVGIIFEIQKNKQAYFKEKPKGYWIKLKYVYENLETCINALHYFKIKGKRLKKGFIGKY